jgi:hypothetical protein
MQVNVITTMMNDEYLIKHAYLERYNGADRFLLFRLAYLLGHILEPRLVDGFANLRNGANVDAAVEAAEPESVSVAVFAIDVKLSRRPTFGNSSVALAGVLGVDEGTAGRRTTDLSAVVRPEEGEREG